MNVEIVVLNCQKCYHCLISMVTHCHSHCHKSPIGGGYVGRLVSEVTLISDHISQGSQVSRIALQCCCQPGHVGNGALPTDQQTDRQTVVLPIELS